MFEAYLHLLGIDVPGTFTPSEAPGEDEDNAAHVHMESDLSEFDIEYDPTLTDHERNLSVLHELLHVAFRHVGAVAAGLDGPAKAWLVTALEEDTERLAKALHRASAPVEHRTYTTA